MPILFNWYDSDCTILLWKFEDNWEWDEYYAAIDRSNAMVRQQTHPVTVIIDMHEVQSFPRGIMTHATSGLMVRPANVNLAIIVVKNPALRTLYHNFVRLADRLFPGGMTIALADDMESALHIIENRVSLNSHS